ncbi:MAG: DUF1127 domain-containing protein [Pseudomonadota bacterium]
MNTTANTTAPFGAITVHRIVSVFDEIRVRFATQIAARRTAAELRALSPRQLEDIGVLPMDIELFESGRF